MYESRVRFDQLDCQCFETLGLYLLALLRLFIHLDATLLTRHLLRPTQSIGSYRLKNSNPDIQSHVGHDALGDSVLFSKVVVLA
jgi:hypothetical protein